MVLLLRVVFSADYTWTTDRMAVVKTTGILSADIIFIADV